MLIVADSSPLILLVNIEHIDVLPTLFGHVYIPPEVSAELHDSRRPRNVQHFIGSLPPWLIERRPAAIEPIRFLHPAELAAISLAVELKADLLLIDEARGRRAAADRRLPYTGTIGLLERAADQRLLDLQDAFARIKKTDFWVSHDLLDARLKLHLTRRRDTRS